MMKRIFLLVALAIVVTSCVERIEISTLTQPQQLVVFGYLSDAPGRYSIELSKTQPYFGVLDSTDLFVNGAEVTINGERLQEDPTGVGCYYTVDGFAAEPGVRYDLVISVDFDGDGAIDRYTASTQLPQEMRLDSLDLRYTIVELPTVKRLMLAANVFFQPHGGECPGASYSLSDHPVLDRLSRHTLSPFGRLTQTDYIAGFPLLMIQPDRIAIRGGDTLYFRPLSQIDFHFMNYTAELFTFIKVAQQERNGGNPLFSGPPANLPSNIEGGAKGCFGAIRQTTVSRKLEWKSEYVDGLWRSDLENVVVLIQNGAGVVIDKGESKYVQVGDTIVSNFIHTKDSPDFSCTVMGQHGLSSSSFWVLSYYRMRLGEIDLWRRISFL